MPYYVVRFLVTDYRYVFTYSREQEVRTSKPNTVQTEDVNKISAPKSDSEEFDPRAFSGTEAFLFILSHTQCHGSITWSFFCNVF
jgi:hypothetical protein